MAHQFEVILLSANGAADNTKKFAESFASVGFKVVQFNDLQSVQLWANSHPESSDPVVILLSLVFIQSDFLRGALQALVPTLQNRLILPVYLEDVASDPALTLLKNTHSVNAFRVGVPNAISECISALTEYMYLEPLGSTRGFPAAAAPSPSAEKEFRAKSDVTSQPSLHKPGEGMEKAKKEEEAQQTETKVVGAVYSPKEIQRFAKETMLVYIAPDNAEALKQVESDAQSALDSRISDYTGVAGVSESVLKYGAELTIIPELEGFLFEPATQTVVWKGETIRAKFSMQTTSVPANSSVNGSVKVALGPITFIEVRISVFVQPEQGAQKTLYGTAIQIAHNFHKIFVSYSHKDTEIVLSCKKAGEMLNNKYLMDITDLHSGDKWDDKLLRLIDEADVFQLFWSKNSAKSQNVEKEWRRAVKKQENLENSTKNTEADFVQPRFWSKIIYEPIPELLNKFHFEKIDTSRLGMKKRQGFWNMLFGKNQ